MIKKEKGRKGSCPLCAPISRQLQGSDEHIAREFQNRTRHLLTHS